MKKVCVIIPVHKPTLSVDEIKSLNTCNAVLKGYDCFLVYPEGMNTSEYETIHNRIRLQPVPATWLSSLTAYNKMKCSLSFYQLFSSYEYMLTYELDAFIFSDNWDNAHCFQYDYIGAPWFKNFGKNLEDTTPVGVGNSGFSMRNISTCIRILQMRESIRQYWKLFAKSGLQKMIRFSVILNMLHSKIWKIKGLNYYFTPFTTEDHVSEDIFWGSVVPHIVHFKVASIEDAMRFSFEVHPSQLFQLNHQQLPLGCHAWQKYDAAFWRPFIS